MRIENNHKELNLSSDKKDLETINVGDEDKNDNVSVVRKVNKKAKIFFQKLKKYILCEIRPINYNNI